MLPIPFPQRYPLPRTVWVCPQEGCDHQETGYPNGPLGRGYCRGKVFRKHPRRGLVRQAADEADQRRHGLRGPHEE